MLTDVCFDLVFLLLTPSITFMTFDLKSVYNVSCCVLGTYIQFTFIDHNAFELTFWIIYICNIFHYILNYLMLIIILLFNVKKVIGFNVDLIFIGIKIERYYEHVIQS